MTHRLFGRYEPATGAELAHARLVPGVGRIAKPPLLLVQVGDERAQMLHAPRRPG